MADGRCIVAGCGEVGDGGVLEYALNDRIYRSVFCVTHYRLVASARDLKDVSIGGASRG